MARKARRPAITIELTPEQKQQIQRAAEKKVLALEPLEQRIAPGVAR